MSRPTVVGCLLDVSGSMRDTLETEGGDIRAVERLRAVIRAAVQLARAEQKHDPDALLFVGVFGLDIDMGCPASIDLCSAIEGALAGGGGDEGLDGHQLLIRLANRRNRSHITRYIETKLKEHEARIIYSYLQRHPEGVDEFTAAIPSSFVASFGINVIQQAADFSSRFGIDGPSEILDSEMEDSDAMKIARRICRDWLNDFSAFQPRKIESVIRLLETLDAHMDNSDRGGQQRRTLLDDLRDYMYGRTPMRDSLNKAAQVFRDVNAPPQVTPSLEEALYNILGAETWEAMGPLLDMFWPTHSDPTQGPRVPDVPDDQLPPRQRVLVLISDGESTDGDPAPVATRLKNDGVVVATIFLTNRTDQVRKELYDKPPTSGWSEGQRALFNITTRVSGAAHPIPVLTSIGWKIPSSGECGLYTAVCSTDALEEFCSALMSARFGSADVLFDMLERLNHDSYVNDEYVRVCRNPSDQGSEGVCYAHATAAVIHMALLRIVDREGGCPSIQSIRDRIMAAYPAVNGGHPTARVLEEVAKWYRPLRFREVDEDGARQAVLRRRPVLMAFRLTQPGWMSFCQHFDNGMSSARPIRTLTLADMQHRVGPDGGGHAVVMTGCDPQSLTFLNSWGDDWGNHGSFSVESAKVLEREFGPPHGARVFPARFYDVYWLESDLTPTERAAYNRKADEAVQAQAAENPSVFAMEVRCPLCRTSSSIPSFRGSIRRATCPQCQGSFAPEPGYLGQALYARAGLGEAV